MKDRPAIRKDKFESLVGKGMHLETIILREINIQKLKYWIVTLLGETQIINREKNRKHKARSFSNRDEPKGLKGLNGGGRRG